MPSQLSKVHKHIKVKKGSKVNSLHENSRDARRLRKAGARDERVARSTAVRDRANASWLERVAFFRDRLPDTLHPATETDMGAWIGQFVARNDAELEELRKERRAGRPMGSRQRILEDWRATEEREWETGFWLPDLRDGETLVRLDGWLGDWVGLGTMRFVRIERAGCVVKESGFPPRGSA